MADPRPDDDGRIGKESENPLAEALRESGARRADVNGVEAYQTNRGTVVVGSPGDLKRGWLYGWRSRSAPASPAVIAKTKQAFIDAGIDPSELDVDWGEDDIAGSPELPYIFRHDRHGRKNQPCAVLARDTKSYAASFVMFKLTFQEKNFNSCLVKFADGFTMVASRNALKRRA